MATALALAERGLGNVWPNPAVGCVLVKEGRIVGRGWTRPGGRPHAETEALARAGDAARGSTAYVTLEPCAHHGRTPPCTTALIAAGIARCVVATVDPDPRVDGRGLGQLRAAGIEVEVGCLAEPARRLAAGFLIRVRHGRPLVALKLAMSVDGRIAAATGHSQWITGPTARQAAHGLRLAHDAVMVGSGTVLADDPMLTCRLPGVRRQPVRVVLDRRLRLPVDAALVRTAGDTATWVFTRGHRRRRIVDLEAAGVGVFPLAAAGPDDALREALALLAGQGITRVLVEGGTGLATALIRGGLVDRLYLFTAPLVIGGDGLPAVAGLGVQRVDTVPHWRLLEERRLGPDRLAVMEAADEPPAVGEPPDGPPASGDAAEE